ncbi:MAG: ComEC/Rec2 family competence protein, partial [Thermoanaerobaculia bacterium]
VFLDVGQGDSTVFRWGTRAVLIDGGGRPDDWRFGESRLLPLLVDRGIVRVDAVMLSHPHPDHCAGLLAVVRHLAVGEVWISPRKFRGECASRLMETIRDSRVPIRLVRTVSTLAGGEVRFTAIPPERNFRQATENNASMVVLIETQRRRILMTGDLQAEGEIDLSDRDIAADVLKVAHHGSRSSTTDRFLEAVRPRVAAISCGRHNLFGNPHPDVLASLASRGVRTWRTDRSGSIELKFSGGKIFVLPEIDTPTARP